MTATPDPRPDATVSDAAGSDSTVLDALRAAFAPEGRQPALGQEEVERWEAENGVVLPEPYRAFVAEVANGSSLGPPGEGGLQPLGRLPDGWPESGPRRPGEPFPLVDAWPGEDEEEDPGDTLFTHGSVVLGSEDGDSFWLLVTAGPCRGEVWMVADAVAMPTPGAGADGDAARGRTGFAEWVERWRSGGLSDLW
ncbi:SMI1/KNR4 family protein [Kitasatospora sp. NPDC101183]|uniref:SMI1/KNR4 family protein n=1 Tax=Kitasatospora sp. NPDC101183 TaxID=3364100 RepID=UPI003817A8D7